MQIHSQRSLPFARARRTRATAARRLRWVALLVLVLVASGGCGSDDSQDLTQCTNGVLDAGEQCDDGNRSDADDCTTICRTARCGDSVVHTDVETCDGTALNGMTCASLGLSG